MGKQWRENNIEEEMEVERTKNNSNKRVQITELQTIIILPENDGGRTRTI